MREDDNNKESEDVFDKNRSHPKSGDVKMRMTKRVDHILCDDDDDKGNE